MVEAPAAGHPLRRHPERPLERRLRSDAIVDQSTLHEGLQCGVAACERAHAQALDQAESEQEREQMLKLELRDDGEGFATSGELVETAKARFEEGKTWLDRLRTFGRGVVTGDATSVFGPVQEAAGLPGSRAWGTVTQPSPCEAVSFVWLERRFRPLKRASIMCVTWSA